MILGERTRLRAIEREDIELIWQWENDPALSRLATAYPERTFAKHDILDWYEKTRRDQTQAWLIIEQTGHGGSTPIGLIGYDRMSFKDRHCWLAIYIASPEGRSLGLGRDAIKAFTSHLFEQLGVHKILAITTASNIPMIQCGRACGFQEEARLAQYFFLDGHWEDAIILSASRWKLQD